MRKLFDLVGKITVEGIEGLQKNLKEINSAAESVIKPLGRMGNQLTRLGTQMSKNLTVPIAAAGVAIYKGVEAVSDLAETVSKVNQIFSESAGDIDKWSNSTAGAIGQSKQQAMDAAATFAIFGKSAGKTGKDLSDFSIQFSELASDLASFHNTSPEDAITAIGAAMRGENEPIRRYGVLLDDASMRQKALELNIVSTSKNALTPQQKVLAAQALILEQTKDAQGDFARTSGGLANQTRIWKAEVADLTAKLGKSFLPIALDVTKIFREKLLPIIEKIVNWWNNLPSGVQETVIKLAAFVAIAGPAVILLGQIVSSVTMISTALKTAQVALLAFNATMLASPFGIVIVGIAAATAAMIGLINEYKNLQEEHKKFTIMTVDQAKKNEFVKSYDEMVTKVKQYGDALKDESQFNNILGDSINDLTKKAEDLGYVITGNNEERLKALNTISLEIQGVRDQNGQLITYTNSVEENTNAKHKNKVKTEEELEAEKKLAEKRADFEKEWTQKVLEQAGNRLQILENERIEALKKAKELNADITEIEKYYSLKKQSIAKEESDKKIEFENEWNRKVLESSGDRLSILKFEKREAIKNAEEIGANTLAIQNFYDQERAKLADEAIKKWQNANREAALKDVEEYAKTTKEKSDLEKKLADFIIEAFNVTDEEMKEKVKYTTNLIIGSINQIFGAFSQYYQNREVQIDNELKTSIAAIDTLKTSEIAAVNASKMSEEDKKKAIEKINEDKEKAIEKLNTESDKKKRDLMRKQAATEKASAIFSIALSTAEGMMKAWTIGPIAGPIFSAIVGALGAVQMALVATKPLPLAEGGLAKSKDGGINAIIAEGGQDELVLPLKTGVEILAGKLFERMNNVVLQHSAVVDKPFNYDSFANNKTIVKETHLHIGTFIGDKTGLKQLERMLRDIRVEENTRFAFGNT